MALIAITGGIGSGKSVVSKILLALGYPVYDCDSEAKKIMDSSSDIKNYIREHICNRAILRNDIIDRTTLADVVFQDNVKLEKLNAVVHGAVKKDLPEWALNKSVAFVETAILYQSGLDKIVDAVWEVTAPEEIRLLRVMKRNNLTSSQVEDRIKSQNTFIVADKHPTTFIINNDGVIPLLPRIISLLNNL